MFEPRLLDAERKKNQKDTMPHSVPEQKFRAPENQSVDAGKKYEKEFQSLTDRISIEFCKLEHVLDEETLEFWKGQCRAIVQPFVDLENSGSPDDDISKVPGASRILTELKRFCEMLPTVFLLESAQNEALTEKNKRIKPYEKKILDLTQKIREHLIDLDIEQTETETRLHNAMDSLKQAWEKDDYPLESLDPHIEALEKRWEKIESQKKRCNELETQILQLKAESKEMLAELELQAKSVADGFRQRLRDIIRPEVVSPLDVMLGRLRDFHKDLKSVLDAVKENDSTSENDSQVAEPWVDPDDSRFLEAEPSGLQNAYPGMTTFSHSPTLTAGPAAPQASFQGRRRMSGPS